MDKTKKYKYITEYKKQTYARVILEVAPEEKAAWKQAAELRGMSLQGYVKSIMNAAVAEEMKDIV